TLSRAADTPWRILRYTALSLEHSDKGRAVSYWRRLLARRPGDMEAQRYLAAYYEALGQVDKALPHLLALRRRYPRDHNLLKRLGKCYLGLKDLRKALKCLVLYRHLVPADLESARLVVQLQAALGNKDETLKALRDYIAIEPRPDRGKLKQAAELYGEKGLYSQALDIWRRLLGMSPDDPEILRAMANNFLAIGHNEEALKIWKHLARVSPHVIDVYRPMARLLRRMGRRQELTEVLEAIYEIAPGDENVKLQLAAIYIGSGRDEKAAPIIESLRRQGCKRPEFYYWQGRLAESGRRLSAALKNYDRLLHSSFKRLEILGRAIRIAGELGRLDEVGRYLTLRRALKRPISEALALDIAGAFANCEAWQEAIDSYERIINETANKKDWPQITPVRARLTAGAALGLAAVWRRDGRLYEAGQALRRGLFVSGAGDLLVPRLFDLALLEGRPREAGRWLTLLHKGKGIAPWDFNLLKARLLLAGGEENQARRLALRLEDELQGGAAGENKNRRRTGRQLALADFWARLAPGRAAGLCKAVLAREPANPRARVILLSLGHLTISALIREIRRLPTADMLVYARLARQYDQPALASLAAAAVEIREPDSLTAKVISAWALIREQRYRAGAAAWEALAARRPNDLLMSAQAVRAAFYSGDPTLALKISQTAAEAGHDPQILLLRARILWQANKWPAAMRIYQQFLRPGVDRTLMAMAGKKDITLPKPERQESLWRRISLAPVNESPLADILMAPTPPGKSNSYRRWQLSVAGLYARYRWQQEYAAEYLVRRTVRSRAYFTAAKRYKSLTRQYPADKSLLFDLAGVYSRLGRLGDEAAIYDRLSADGIRFAQLESDRRRNKLKLRPQVLSKLDYIEEEGRNGFKDIRIMSSGLAFKLPSGPGREWHLDLRRRNYHGVNADGANRANRIFAAWHGKVLNGIGIGLGGGLESNTDQGGNTSLFYLKVKAKAGDKLTADLSFGQDVVPDTLSSIRQGISRRQFKGRVAFEPLSRLALGAGYTHSRYSDDNWGNGYDLWSSLLLHSEPYFLQARYRYSFADSRAGNGPALNTGEPTNYTRHPYWSPKNYWLNEVGVYFKHLLSRDNLGRGLSKYYTMEYYVGHDADGYAFQHFIGGAFFELNNDFSLRARGEWFSASFYRKKELGLSISYRW
ncbi:MAG TPA: tetratricopeptide repeat protein, partial [Desulfobacterales bacterium]|nr:tetratricopeptide repeat protein [Desulfobacterales bacterium]